MVATVSVFGNANAAIGMGDRKAQQALRMLTGRTLPAAEAQAVWPRIVEHKWFLSEQLGRDVGFRVAAIDYFENIEPQLSARAA